MVNHNQLTIAILPANKTHFSGRAGVYGSTHGCINVLASMEFVRASSKGIPTASKATLEFARDGPHGRRVPPTLHHGFISIQDLFKMSHLFFQRWQAIERKGGSAGPGSASVLMHYSGFLGNLSRSVFHALDAVTQFIQFLPLAFVLGSKA